MHPYQFTSSDYNSSDGMLTTVWGPLLWHFLHIVSFNYPVEPTQTDINRYYTFLCSLGNVLPCSYCRQNFPENFERSGGHDIKNYISRERFSRLIYRLHNHVNAATGKSSHMEYTAVRDRYEIFRARCVRDVPSVPRYPGARYSGARTRMPQGRTAREAGCTNPVYGQKAKSIIMIVPQGRRVDPYLVDPKCMVLLTSEEKKI